MPPERERRCPEPTQTPVSAADPGQELEELLFTLEICRRALPWDAHPEHVDRLRRIAGLVRWSLERR